jgi:hypothetical protein
MSNEEYALQPQQGTGMTAEEEAALAKDDGLGFITMMHGVSEAVVRNSPKGVRAGDFLLSGRTLVPAGNNGDGFIATVGITRPRAVFFKNNAVEKDSWDPKSSEWQEIAALVAGRVQGAKVGYEFMLWLPEHDFMGVLMVANRDRFEAGQKLINLRNERKLAKVTTLIRGKNNSVVLHVEEAKVEGPIALPTPERLATCTKAFEAYKTEQKAPKGPRR